MNICLSPTINQHTADVVNDFIYNSVSGPVSVSTYHLISNLNMGCASNSPDECRSIDGKKLKFLLSNYGIILYYLVSDSDCRQLFIEAIDSEKTLDTEDVSAEEYYAGLSGERYADNNIVVVNFENYDESTYNKVMKNIRRSYDKVPGIKNTVSTMLNNLDIDARNELSYIFSNFMYVFRALSRNPLLFSEMKDAVESF